MAFSRSIRRGNDSVSLYNGAIIEICGFNKTNKVGTVSNWAKVNFSHEKPAKVYLTAYQ